MPTPKAIHQKNNPTLQKNMPIWAYAIFSMMGQAVGEQVKGTITPTLAHLPNIVEKVQGNMVANDKGDVE